MSEIIAPNAVDNVGLRMHLLMTELYPICRSITGDGFRKSLAILQKQIPIEIHEVPSGTAVFDWTVPREWNVKDAYVKDPDGKKVIDFHHMNLHLVSYSTPIQAIMPLSELKKHLYSLPQHPDWIPYRSSYYKESWGFCLSHHTLENLKDGDYEVCIDTTLEDGHLTYGEYFIKGETTDEVLISCHCCHPSLCNDNLSGMVLATFLAKNLESKPLRYSYRFLFIPVTIGSITWLSLNQERVPKIKHGLVVAGVGDPGKLTYKKSRRGDAEIDHVVRYVLSHSSQEYKIIDFFPYGYDERQYCSPGFDLPVGSLTRTPHDQYPEYHTSADNLDFVQPAYLEDSFINYAKIIDILEKNKKYMNTNPKCEPQLGKRGLYSTFGGKKDSNVYEMAMLWVLNYSDGYHTLLDIADNSALEFNIIEEATVMLEKHGLLKELE